ncbi:MAG: cellulose binding domain-containing protein [Lachnospira sp.]|nr:cellulose binding domain-containing protein [Lachnospira sp.]
MHKKTTKYALKRMLSVVLIISMVMQLIPFSVYAAETGAQKSYYDSGCTITYKENSTWGNYVNADVTIKNNTDYPKSLWSLYMDYDGNIDSIWNADIVSNIDGIYEIAAKDYNTTIEAGQTVSFGFIAYGKDSKPSLPKAITFVNSKVDDEGDEEDATVSSEINIGDITYTIPDEWEGLKYALFTSGDKGLTFYTNTTRITGSIHTNQNYYYQGNTLSIDGVLKAAKGITLKTSNGTDTLKVKAKKENAQIVDMPDITEIIYNHIKINGTVYKTNQSYKSNNINISTPIGINGDVDFNSTTFTGQGIIYATDNVTYNVGTLATEEDASVFVVSKNGDITLNGTAINLNAVLYAPNGTVTVNANEFHLNGRIIAKEININGTIIEINAGPLDFSMLGFMFEPKQEGIIKRYDTKADFSEGTSEGITVTTKDEKDYLTLVEKEKSESVEKQATYETALFKVNEKLSGSLGEDKVFTGTVMYDFTRLSQEMSNITVRQNHAYAVSDEMVTWTEAREICEEMGGHLVVIDDAEENEYIKELLIAEGKDGYVSIGYTDEVNEGRWQWVNGSDNTYTNWDAVEPNNGHTTGNPQNHAHMYSDGTWDDGWLRDCYFVCEWDRIEDSTFYDNRIVILEMTVADVLYLPEGLLESFEGDVKVNDDGSINLIYKTDLNSAETITLPIRVEQYGRDTEIIKNVTLQYVEEHQVQTKTLSNISLEGTRYIEKGTWEAVYDSKVSGTKWSYLDVKATYKNNADIEISACAAETENELEVTELQVVQDSLLGLEGRYIRICVKFSASADGKSSVADYIEIGGNTDKQSKDSKTTIEKVSIQGVTQAIKGAKYTFRVNTQADGKIASPCQWFVNGKKLNVTGNELQHIFNESGEYTVKAGFDVDGDGIVEFSDKKKVNVSEAKVSEGLRDISLAYPVFNISVDKMSYVAGDTVVVTTDIGSDISSATVTYDGNTYAVTDVNDQHL